MPKIKDLPDTPATRAALDAFRSDPQALGLAQAMQTEHQHSTAYRASLFLAGWLGGRRAVEAGYADPELDEDGATEFALAWQTVLYDKDRQSASA